MLVSLSYNIFSNVIDKREAWSARREIKTAVFNASVFRLPCFKLGGIGQPNL